MKFHLKVPRERTEHIQFTWRRSEKVPGGGGDIKTFSNSRGGNINTFSNSREGTLKRFHVPGGGKVKSREGI